MNTERALSFLKLHQPMPADLFWTDELSNEYIKITNYFITHPNIECIPLLLNSFGEGDGLGTYQLVEDVLFKFNPREVIPHLIQALYSEHESVKYWTTQICASFPDERMIKPLLILINSSEWGTRYFCYFALEQILIATDYDYSEQFLELFRSRRLIETDPEMLNLFDEIEKKIKANAKFF